MPPSARPPLPLKSVERLWAQLTVVYGSAFLRQYEGVDLDVVKADWGMRLAWTTRPDGMGGLHAPAIGWALDRLPVEPPNAIAFNRLCQTWAEPTALALPFPGTEPSLEVKTALAKLGEPVVHTEPEHIVVARRFVDRWGGEGLKLDPRRADLLRHYLGIIARHEEHVASEKEREAAGAPPNDWCSTMRRRRTECGCPDCGPSIIDLGPGLRNTPPGEQQQSDAPGGQ